MAKLPIVKPKEAIRALQKAGFHIHHQTGSHARLIHSTNPALRVTVPIHNKDLPKGTLANIIRQAGLNLDEFLSYLA
ncbi:type II toxin-antitoxin system HicA family toxin [candidate division KSB1 bacterium]|nr:type II toxin-antitoxin system HicA family toxin [candidate division KSB1 bacterium]